MKALRSDTAAATDRLDAISRRLTRTLATAITFVLAFGLIVPVGSTENIRHPGVFRVLTAGFFYLTGDGGVGAIIGGIGCLLVTLATLALMASTLDVEAGPDIERSVWPSALAVVVMLGSLPICVVSRVYTGGHLAGSAGWGGVILFTGAALALVLQSRD
ncbi:MAG: hypothetical protein ACK5OX_05115 [Desertimonas sp.]